MDNPRMAVGVDSLDRTTITREGALVERARHGDRDAFALLMEPRAVRLLRTARAILGNEADAHEAAQEAMVTAWVQLPGLRDPDRFHARLSRTLVNKCRDALRRRKRVRESDLGDLELAVPDAADARIAIASVNAAFERLTADERHILVLHHLDELPLTEIAKQ